MDVSKRVLWVLVSALPLLISLGCGDSDAGPGPGGGGAGGTGGGVGGGGAGAEGGASSGPCAGTTPAVTGSSGALADGQTVTISGEGFCTKDPVAPWIWDTFESGTAGESIAEWNLWNDDGPSPQYTDSVVATGARSAALNFEGRQTHNSLIQYHDTTHRQMYGSLRYQFVKTGGFDSRNIKLFRLLGTMPGDPVHGTPVISWGGQDSQSPLDPSNPESYDEPNGWMSAMSGSETCRGPNRMYGDSPRDQWHAISQWIHLSDPDGAENGTFGRRLNDDFQQEQGVTKCADSISPGLDEIAIGLYLAHDRDIDNDGDGVGDGVWEYVQSDYMIYVDDVYVDITLARVEICDAPQWEDGACQVQIPHTTWNDATIELTAHQGALPSSTPLYLFVMNAGGAVSEPLEVQFD